MRRVFLIGLATSVSLLIPPDGMREADACGGCFTPTDTVTNVEAHRMVIALSLEETILWDQIQYSGSPEDFVWVLPVPSPETTIEIADPVFFDEIDSQTSPRIRPATPLFPCNSGASCGAGFAAGDTAAVDIPTMPEDDVTVFAEETIGPYETVIIGSEDAGALRGWLGEHNYQVPVETESVINHYIESGSVFVVLRLAPGEGVQAMQPVRVRYPGYMGQFPLKMVTVGSRGLVDLSLWVIGEQRYETRNFKTIRLDDDHLVWDWQTNSSNYPEAFSKSIDDAGGRAWVAEYASRLNDLIFSSRETDAIFAAQPYPYVTRLRTSMLVDNLNEDLVLAPALDPGDIDPLITAFDEINRPGGDCNDRAIREHGCAAAATGVAAVENFGPVMLLFLGVVLLRRRRRRREAK